MPATWREKYESTEGPGIVLAGVVIAIIGALAIAWAALRTWRD